MMVERTNLSIIALPFKTESHGAEVVAQQLIALVAISEDQSSISNTLIL